VLDDKNPNPIEKLTRRKRPKKVAKNRRVDNLEAMNQDEGFPLEEIDTATFRSLKLFCVELLDGGRYNKLMKITKDLVRFCKMFMVLFCDYFIFYRLSQVGGRLVTTNSTKSTSFPWRRL
jgi:hypothetical protein